MTKKSLVPVILFDDKCTLCRRFKDALQFLDKENRLSFVSIHNRREIHDLNTNLKLELNKKELAETVHLIDESYSLHRGVEVVEYLIKFYPAAAKLRWLLESNRGKKAVQFFYDKVNQFKRSKVNPCRDCHK